MDFGTKLRIWGKKNFGTLVNFANALGINDSSLQRYLNNQRAPGKEIFQKLVRLGCDLNWLLSSESDLLVKDEKQSYYNKVSQLKQCQQRLAEKEELLNLLYKELDEKTEEIKKLKEVPK